MQKYIVPYICKGSLFGEEEIEAVANLLRSDEPLAFGSERTQFETEFANFIGTKYALTVTNCTVGLEFATHLIGLKPGDEVIATPFTYQATLLPLLDKEVKVRFCDIDPNSLSINPNNIQSLITAKTRAIYLTHYGGYMADMNPIMELANQHNIIVIEDCAHANGSKYQGKMAGSIGHIGCFSFQSLKNMSTLGQGGMLTFNNDRWFEIIKKIRAAEPDADFVSCESIEFGNYGKPAYGIYGHEKNSYTHECTAIRHTGTNSTLSEPACAVGRIQLTKLNSFNQRRKNIAAYLNQELSSIPEIRVQKWASGYEHVQHLYTFFLKSDSRLNRDEFAANLEAAGIQIILRYFPLHLLPEWRLKGHKFGECPTTEKIWFEQLINLPCYPAMTDEQVIYMADKIVEIIKKKH
ncbi:DegT/DnrJ/EryC1/StrS family aminotransferase [Nostoc sp. CENA67]|uniref:DegT/DnrJ/EryC1/StrS family aminotransferase n=1 Tax=Amazonocrinis nigriterrae CENA67 TaxID=2794033 RepID=A0A8J7HQX9_9NOST|nr:DegT/DnrJ/EryC1/StrS family aminotransferase [Amazonocrinis nigriterrae]MBH8561890.1 DegT/DnrJ/EryC1/StrS family aminotransferase [Amazonocrinis nigriterrae CENA67]